MSKTKYELLEEIMNEGVKFTQTIWTTVSDAGTSNNIHLKECNSIKKKPPNYTYFVIMLPRQAVLDVAHVQFCC